MNKYLTWSGFHCFSVCFVPSGFGFFRCIRISEWTHLQFPLGFCGSDQLPSAVFQIDPSDFLLACVISFWSIWFFAFSFFSDLLLLFLDFAVVFLLRLASWFCQVPFLQLLFWSFRFCPFDSVFTNFPVPYSFFDSSACFRYCPFHSETSSEM